MVKVSRSRQPRSARRDRGDRPPAAADPMTTAASTASTLEWANPPVDAVPAMVGESPGPRSQEWHARMERHTGRQRDADGHAAPRRLRVGPRRHADRRRRQPLPRLLQRHRHHQHRPRPPARRRGDRPRRGHAGQRPRLRHAGQGPRPGSPRRGHAAGHVAVHVLLVGHRGHRGCDAGGAGDHRTLRVRQLPQRLPRSHGRGGERHRGRARRTRLRDAGSYLLPSGHAYRCAFCAGSCDLRCARFVGAVRGAEPARTARRRGDRAGDERQRGDDLPRRVRRARSPARSAPPVGCSSPTRSRPGSAAPAAGSPATTRASSRTSWRSARGWATASRSPPSPCATSTPPRWPPRSRARATAATRWPAPRCAPCSRSCTPRTSSATAPSSARRALAQMTAMAERHPIIGEVRGRGALLAIELVQGQGDEGAVRRGRQLRLPGGVPARPGVGHGRPHPADHAADRDVVRAPRQGPRHHRGVDRRRRGPLRVLTARLRPGGRCG